VEPGISNWLCHWDSGWYLSIPRIGYYVHSQGQCNVVFFPLYPLLMYWFGFLTSDLRTAGYLVSNGFLFASCLMLWKLVARDYGSRALADRAVLFLLLSPLTVFYSSIYTESLFLFLMLAVAYLADGRRWLAAGLCGFFGALARPPGILLVILIAVEYGAQVMRTPGTGRTAQPFSWGEAGRALVGVALPVIGLGVYALYLHVKFGDSLAFAHAQAGWSQHLAPFWELPWALPDDHPFHVVWICVALVISLLFFALGIVFRLRPSHLVLTAVFIVLYASLSNPAAIPRFLSVLFPFYIIAAEICLRRPRWEPFLLATSAAHAAFSIVLFVDGYWFT